MSSKKEDKEKNPVAYIRERFFEKLRNWRPSPELVEATKQKTPIKEKETDEKASKKRIARQNPKENLDL